MSRKLLVALALPLLLASSVAWAQEAAATDETAAEPRQPMQWGVYLGFLPGGVVSRANFDYATPSKERDAKGLTPELDDIEEIGGIWAIALSKRTWFQVRAAVGQTAYFDTPNGRVDSLVYSIDLALMPRWEWGFYQLGIPFGFGWAQFDADGPLADGDVPGSNYTLPLKSAGAGTYFLGVYNGFKLGEKSALFLDLRYKNLHRTLNVTAVSLPTWEATFGFVRTF